MVKKKVKKFIGDTKSLLNLPSEYLLGIPFGSNISAFDIKSIEKHYFV